MSFTGIAENASSEDVDVNESAIAALQVSVTQNSSDITTANAQIATNSAKPSSSAVDLQIDAKNATQMTQLHTKTETDTAVAIRTTPADVQTALNTRFQAQDASNFMVFQDRANSINTSNGYTQTQVDAAVAVVANTAAANTSAITAAAATTYTKTQVDAIETSINNTAASTYARQSALATVTASAATNTASILATQTEVVLLQSAVTQNSAQGNTSASTLAGVVAGTQTLSAVDVQGNLTTTGNAIVGSNLQCVDLTATGRILSSSWGAFGSIPLNPQTRDLSCLSLSSANVNVSGNLTVNGQAVTGGAASVSAGDVLKITRTEIANGNIFIATNGSFTTITSVWHTPSDACSYLLIDFVGVWTIHAPSGSDDGQWQISLEVDNSKIGSTTFKCLGNRESGSTSPVWGRYTNSSTSAKQIVLYGKQTHSADQGLHLNGNLGSAKQTWIQITEVKR